MKKPCLFEKNCNQVWYQFFCNVNQVNLFEIIFANENENDESENQMKMKWKWKSTSTSLLLDWKVKDNHKVWEMSKDKEKAEWVELLWGCRRHYHEMEHRKQWCHCSRCILERNAIWRQYVWLEHGKMDLLTEWWRPGCHDRPWKGRRVVHPWDISQ